MTYEYSGYLGGVRSTPEPQSVRAALDAVAFDGPDLLKWQIEEHDRERDGEHIPLHRAQTQDGVRIEGRFENIRAIDLRPNELHSWVSLSSLCRKDDRFPIDTSKYPIIEVTYRCLTPNAHPAWMWTYPGGTNCHPLPCTQEWRTVARHVAPLGFPRCIDSVTLRVYSTARSAEAIEVASVRFRAPSPHEASALLEVTSRTDFGEPCAHYPLLDTFVPQGTFLHAKTAAQLSHALGLSLEEYWDLVMDDIARHHNNTAIIERADVLPSAQFRTLLQIAGSYQVRLVPMYEFRRGGGIEQVREFARMRIAPYASSPAILAWSPYVPPSERGFAQEIQVKRVIEEADPNHPVAHIAEYPNAYPLFGRCYAASALNYTASNNPWGVSAMLREHMPMSKGQQLWVVTPSHSVYRDAPGWNGAPELRLIMSLAFGNGAKGWISYPYHNDLPWLTGSGRRGLTGSFLTFSDLWGELGHRSHQFNALAPLILGTRFAPELQDCFVSNSVRHARTQLPEGVPETSVFRLQGANYDVYCAVSNDMTEMASEIIDIPQRKNGGLAFYDVTDFVRDRIWAPLEGTQHLEMFPGQMHVILVAEPDVCTQWRDAIAAQIVEDDRRQLEIDLKRARKYGIQSEDIEQLEKAAGPDVMLQLAQMKEARNLLLDRVYACAEMCRVQSALFAAAAALAACDLTLSALAGRGRIDEAAALGRKALSLASELARLRVEYRQGNGAAIQDASEGLPRRMVAALAEIRAVH